MLLEHGRDDMLRMIDSEGTLRRFDDCDVMWTLLTIYYNKRISRGSICNIIGLGEGSVRSIVQILNKNGLIEIYRTGIALTDLGKKLMEECPIIPVSCSLPHSSLGHIQRAVILKNGAENITTGMKQRDQAIKSGGFGCSTIVQRDNVIMMPPDWNLDIEEPIIASHIRSSGLMEGDAMFFGEGADERSAMKAALSAAMISMGD